jgi:hypothetical protein
MKDSNYHGLLLKAVNGATLAGTLVWVILIVRAAHQLSKTSGLTEAPVTFGPFLLTQITKRPVENGHIASFSLEAGLTGYISFWLALGVVAGLLLAWRRK